MKGNKLFFLALLLAFAAAGAAYVYLNELEAQSKAAVRLVSVYVPAVEIPARTKLNLSLLEKVEIPEAALHSDAVTTEEELQGAYARERLLPGEQILASRLVYTQNTGSLAYRVSPGHRALTVPVNSVSGVAGFILPGDYVDCIVTIDPPETAEGVTVETITRVVAENIRVLAAGQHVSQDDKQQLTVETITLDAPAESVSAIILALERGSLRLVLRPATDTAARPVQPFRLSQF
ncbi:MAG: Flp pilus assembly protein CpaB [Firmicutes bacterium]|nr:Flp pilus assembly protein CpaB [Bacillota bacterium]